MSTGRRKGPSGLSHNSRSPKPRWATTSQFWLVLVPCPFQTHLWWRARFSVVLRPSPPVQLRRRRGGGALVASGETWAIFVLFSQGGSSAGEAGHPRCPDSVGCPNFTALSLDSPFYLLLPAHVLCKDLNPGLGLLESSLTRPTPLLSHRPPQSPHTALVLPPPRPCPFPRKPQTPVPCLG